MAVAAAAAAAFVAAAAEFVAAAAAAVDSGGSAAAGISVAASTVGNKLDLEAETGQGSSVLLSLLELKGFYPKKF